MSSARTYRTIDREVGSVGQAEITVLRSRFLAQACRVTEEPAAREWVAQVRSARHDARHHCTAFVLGSRSEIQRTNDDGEPSGTAGRPMLDVVLGRGLSDVAVVVTRWFGGTLLGTGGLTRAYGDAVAVALDAAGVRERELWNQSAVTAPIARVGEVENLLRRTTDVIDVTYGPEQVIWTVAHRGELGRLEHTPLDPIWRDAGSVQAS